MRRLTASSLSLASKCVYPWTSGLAWDSTSGPAAKMGTAFHSAAEHYVTTGKADLDALGDEHKLQPYLRKKLAATFERWREWADQQATGEWKCEIPFAVDPLTGDAKVIESKGPRDYSAAPDGWMTGTADVVDSSGELEVIDWKSGNYVEHPSTNPQMRVLGFAAARAFGRDRVTVRIVRTLPEMLIPLKHTFSPFVLRVIGNELRQVREAMVTDAKPSPSVDACRFCPVRAKCPESMAKKKEAA